MAQHDPVARVFKINHVGAGRETPYVVLVLPEPTEWTKVRDAWTHAVRYTAKGLDLPDCEAALRMLKARHPSWEIIDTKVLDAAWDTARAGEDVPDVEL